MNLSNLIRDAMKLQGIDSFDIVIATDGSTTTLIDTTLEDKYGDDELKDGSVLVVRTVAGVAPEGEFSRISAYEEGSQIVTFSSISNAIVAGNTCMLISAEYPLRVLIELANDALRDCGEISGVEVSTTTVEGATEYPLPPGFKNLVGIYLQTVLLDTDNNQWAQIKPKRVIPSAGNVSATLVFDEEFEAGYTLQFIYNGFHPTVSVFNSPINEAIKSPLIVLMLADKIMQWHGVTDENKNFANKILAELEEAKGIYPIRREIPVDKFLTW